MQSLNNRLSDKSYKDAILLSVTRGETGKSTVDFGELVAFGLVSVLLLHMNSNYVFFASIIGSKG